ncbi:hypothetical protein FA95DRAFT_1567742 [Auriscalpium vulgare]|uniref:Uncharacterized protein n=1 Tax=Auriscalpium vulgare TaxID=40419 RepID=A0ACB8R493_9AGAM|nr:hypothetical protein FA95DRAFT_1567742 [Auriscalpium vulgare]
MSKSAQNGGPAVHDTEGSSVGAPPAAEDSLLAILEASRPSPSLIERVKYHGASLPTELQHLLAELTAPSATSSATAPSSLLADSQAVHEQELLRLYPFALEATYCARLVVENERDTAHPIAKTSFWALLIYSALRMKTLGNVKFALSHSSVTSPLSHDYAVASLAVVDVVTGFHQQNTGSSSGHHSPAPSMQPDGGSGGVVAADVGLDDGSSASRVPSIELNAHFVAFPPPGADPGVVMFLVAPPADMPHALDSALHQRRVWGLNGPVVGLQVDQNSVVGRLTWAWFRNDSNSANDIVRVSSRLIHLNDPSDALRFLGFLLRLRTIMHSWHATLHSNAVSVRYSGCDIKKLWRADRIQERQDFQVRRILEWMFDASQSQCPGYTRLSTPTSSVHLSSSGSHSSLVDCSLSQTLTMSAKRTKKSSDSKRKPSSEFAAGRGPSEKVTSPADDFGFDRGTTYFARGSKAAFTATVSQAYENVIALRAPSWTEEQLTEWANNCGASGAILGSVIPTSELDIAPQIASLQEALESMRIAAGEDTSMPTSKDRDVYAFVEAHLNTVIRVSAMAANLLERSQIIPLTEAECRMLFDFMAFIFLPGANGSLASLETVLAYSKNPMSTYPTLDDDAQVKVITDRENLANEWLRATQKDTAPYKFLKPVDPRLSCFQAAQARAGLRVTRLASDTDIEMLKDRLAKEPARGKCDGAGFLAVYLDGISDEVIRKLSLVQTAKPEKTTVKTPAKTVPRKRGPGDLDLQDPRTFVDHNLGDRTASVRALLSKAFPLLLPYLLVEYKKDDPATYAITGYNQTRLYLITAVSFLKALGVVDFTAFGLAVEGLEALLFGAIYSSAKDCIVILDQNVMGFRLYVPDEAYHLSVVLRRLAVTQSAELLEKFEEVKDELIAKLQDEAQLSEILNWHLPQ